MIVRQAGSFGNKGYQLYDSGGFASRVNLSREDLRLQLLAREKRGLDTPEGRERIRREVEEQARQGKCDWATKEPIY